MHFASRMHMHTMNPAALFNLDGHHALVTAGNSGIGLAMARALGLAGARITLVARRPEPLAAAAIDLQAEGIAAACETCDLTDVDALKSMAAKAARGAPIDVLINAAGVNLREPFMQVSTKSWDE